METISTSLSPLQSSILPGKDYSSSRTHSASTQSGINLSLKERAVHRLKLLGLEKPQFLGKGHYAYVYEVQENDKTYAAKILKRPQNKPYLIPLREIEILGRAQHPNLLSLKQLRELRTDDQLDFCLLTKKYFSLPEQVTEEQFLTIALGVAQGLEQLHRLQVLHLDIKRSNVLISAKGRAKIIDFGLARNMNSQLTYVRQGRIGSLIARPPEKVLFTPGELITYRPSDDSWAYGIFLLCLWNSSLDIYDSPDITLFEMRNKLNSRPYLMNCLTGLKCAEMIASLLLRLFDFNPHTRLSISQVVEQLSQTKICSSPLGSTSEVSSPKRSFPLIPSSTRFQEVDYIFLRYINRNYHHYEELRRNLHSLYARSSSLIIAQHGKKHGRQRTLLILACMWLLVRIYSDENILPEIRMPEVYLFQVISLEPKILRQVNYQLVTPVTFASDVVGQ